jgi:hypothetical protein
VTVFDSCIVSLLAPIYIRIIYITCRSLLIRQRVGVLPKLEHFFEF